MGGDPVIERHIPRFVKVIALVVVIGLVTAVSVALVISHEREVAKQEDCERSVQFRADTRAMWVWLGQQFPKSTEEFGLQKKLDELVPDLTCVDGILTPVRPE